MTSSVIGSLLLDHRDRLGPALLGADCAALAVVQADDRIALAVERDRVVGAELPADVALRADLELDDRAEGPPARRVDHVAGNRCDRGLGKVLLDLDRKSTR